MNTEIFCAVILFSIKTTLCEKQCQDRTVKKNKFWVDKMGFSCKLYEGAKWCTTSKGYGIGWNQMVEGEVRVCHGWGSFEKFQRNGISAVQACCACGGGIKNPKLFSYELPTYSKVSDYPYLNDDYHFTAKDEISQNCYKCKEAEVWHDSCGYSCLAYYYGNFCTKDGKTGKGWEDESYGPISAYKNGGKDALEACMACKQN